MSTRKIRVTISDNDVLTGILLTLDKCPVAKAIRRRIKKEYNISVVQTHVEIEIEKTAVRLYLPKWLGRQIECFDNCYTSCTESKLDCFPKRIFYLTGVPEDLLA
jgi:hypothetical protein